MTEHTERSAASKRVQDTLRAMLLEQTFEPGSRLKEVQLCSELGVSRTPIREALFKLEQEGLVKSDLACGFSVNVLSAQEARELYPIIWTLETLALRLSEQRLKSLVPELRLINKQFASIKRNTKKMVELDSQFHEQLTSQCRSRHLLKQLKLLRILILRYEYAYMEAGTWREESSEQHERIIDAIADSKLERAVRALEANWREGMSRIVNWLERQSWEDI